MQSLAFRDVTFTPVTLENTIYITSAQLAEALGYSKENAVTKIYHRNADEFTADMTVTQNGSGGRLPTRLFSLRGCHLVAMFSRTPVAKEFRKWVLDVLDREAKPTIEQVMAQLWNYRLLVSFSYEGKMQVSVLKDNDRIFSPDDLPRYIRYTGFDAPFPFPLVKEIAHAVADRSAAEVDRWKERHEGAVKRLKEVTA